MLAVDNGLAKAGRSGERLAPAHYLLLAVFCLFAFLPGIASLPPTDRDESRFVQSTKQMVESGDYIDIRLQDEPRYKKPAGIYWLQSAAVLVSGKGADAPIWVYRLVSSVGATVAVLVIAWLGAFLFGRQAGLIAGFALAGILILGIESRIAKTDATLLAIALVAQAALARLYIPPRGGESSRAAWVFWIAQGAGILIKGPVILLLSGLTIATVAFFDKDRSWLARLRFKPGIVIALLVAAPWLILISWKTGAEFWREAVGRDLIAKIGSGQESHGFPPGYYFILFSATFWPFAVPAVAAGLKALTAMRSDPRLLFLVAWYIPFWLALEAVPTKLPHYTMPAYPALVLALAWVATGGGDSAPALGWRLWLNRLTVFGAIVVTAGLAAIAVGISPYILGSFSWWGLLAALLIVAAGVVASSRMPALEPAMRMPLAAGCAAAALGLLALTVVPALKPIWLTPQIVSTFESVRPCPDSRLISAGYGEPSLVFLAGTNTLLTDGAEAGKALLADACAVAVISDDHIETFQAALAGKPVAELGSVEGINYSKGTVRVLRFFAQPR